MYPFASTLSIFRLFSQFSRIEIDPHTHQQRQQQTNVKIQTNTVHVLRCHHFGLFLLLHDMSYKLTVCVTALCINLNPFEMYWTLDDSQNGNAESFMVFIDSISDTNMCATNLISQLIGLTFYDCDVDVCAVRVRSIQCAYVLRSRWYFFYRMCRCENTPAKLSEWSMKLAIFISHLLTNGICVTHQIQYFLFNEV